MLGYFADYASAGAAYMAGFVPKEMDNRGRMVFEGYGARLAQGKGSWKARRGELLGNIDGWNDMTTGGKLRSSIPGLLGLGFSAWAMYSGYQENGLTGAANAAVWDLATMSAVARWSYGSPGGRRAFGPSGSWTQLGIKNSGTALKSGGNLAYGARFLGAGVGASIGQSLLGTPGAFIGAYYGAAPIQATLRKPGLLIGAAAVAGVYTVGKGAYNVIKSVGQQGYAHAQAKRGVDTSGSMAAFMTQGAMTMRARAVQAMHKSHLNARSALGQEANFMHMPAKNYHSRYRM